MSGIIGGAISGGVEGIPDSGKGWIAFEIANPTPSTTFNFPIGGGNSTGSDEDRSQRPMPSAGKLKRIQVRVSGNGLLAGMVIVIRKNGLDTTLIRTVPASSNEIVIVTSDVSFVKDDLISFQIRTGAGGTSAVVNTFLQIEFDPIIASVGILGRGGLVTPSGSKGAIGLNGWVFSGEGNIASSGADEFMLLSGNQSNTLGENRNQIPMPKAGKVTGFIVQTIRNTTPSLTLTLRKNGAPTTLLLSFGVNENAIKEIFNEVTFVKDDLLSVELVVGAGAGSTRAFSETQLEFDP